MSGDGRGALIDRAKAEVSRASAVICASGLVSVTSGNVSCRVDDQIVITPRRGRLDAIAPESCRTIRIEDGVETNGNEDFSPSSETPLHLEVYRNSNAGAVVHSHSTYATALSTLVDELPPIHYILAAFGGPVRVAPYATFGTEELAQNVRAALKGRNAALLQNHGAVVYADDLDSAVDRAIQLEWLAKVYLIADASGSPSLLSQSELDTVSKRAETLQYGFEDRS